MYKRPLNRLLCKAMRLVLFCAYADGLRSWMVSSLAEVKQSFTGFREESVLQRNLGVGCQWSRITEWSELLVQVTDNVRLFGAMEILCPVLGSSLWPSAQCTRTAWLISGFLLLEVNPHCCKNWGHCERIWPSMAVHPVPPRLSLDFSFCSYPSLSFIHPNCALQRQFLPYAFTTYFWNKILAPFVACLIQFFVQSEKDTEYA